MTLRLLTIAPKFWPLVDDGSMRLMHWASGLRSRQIQSTIVTARWHTTWPSDAVCREVPVVRLLPPPKSSWSQSHFLRALGRWIILHRRHFDAIYVDDPFATLHLVSQTKVLQGLPLIGRFHASSIAASGEFDAASSLANAADGCRKLTRVVVPDAGSDRRLRSIGIPEDRIVRIPDVSWMPIRRDSALRQLGLHALAKVSGDLTYPQSNRLILTFGDITRRAGVELLAKATGKHLDEGKTLTVWMIGEGNHQRTFYELLRNRSWHRDIMMQGAFDSIEELLQVADLCIFPGEGCSTQYYFPTVLASGVPWMSASSSDVKSAVGQEYDALMFPAGDTQGLYERIDRWIQSPSEVEEQSEKARAYFLQQFPTEQSLERWSLLLKSLVA